MQIAVHSLEMYEMPGINWKTRDLFIYIYIYFNGRIFIEHIKRVKDKRSRLQKTLCVCVFMFV